MKHGLASFVYGVAAVALMLLGGALAVPMHSGARPVTAKDIAVGVVVGCIPFALGIACLFRRWHWRKKDEK